MLSIIKATLLLEPGSSFTLIYGNRNSRSMMFKEALSDLKNRYPQRFQQLYLFSQESLDSPLLSGRRIDRERLTATAARCWISATMTTPLSAGRNR